MPLVPSRTVSVSTRASTVLHPFSEQNLAAGEEVRDQLGFHITESSGGMTDGDNNQG